jgi:hypothetical protein
MSFRLFVYYCALCGAFAAFLGWVAGRLPGEMRSLSEAGVKGLLLGLTVALALSIVETCWNFSVTKLIQSVPRVLVAILISSIGGLIGGVLGQALLLYVVDFFGFVMFGWILTGLLIGVSLAAFDLLMRLFTGADLSAALRKLLNGVLGGTVGGLLGSLLYLLIGGFWKFLFPHKFDKLWSPSAIGFAALGACIGLMIGLAQVILKEAWLKVEAGFRPGREMIISRDVLTVGRAEACDIGLFGDPSVEKVHARILKQGDHYLLADNDTPGGTYLNDERINGPTPLKAGDAIRVGKCVIRFQERQKKK